MKKYRYHLLIYIGFFVLWIGMTRGAVSPLIYPDEAGYIGWARKFAGISAETWRYLPGYGLFLTPVFWLTNDISKAYPVIIFLNCVMGAAIPVLFYSVLGNFLKGKERLIGAVVIGLYPSCILYGNFAMAEVFLTFLYTLLLWSIFQWNKHRWSWVVSFVCCVWMIAAHGRCGAAILGTVAAVCSSLWNKPQRKRVVAVCCGFLAVFSLVGVWYLSGTKSVNGVHLREQLLQLCSMKGVWNSISTFLSQNFYLILSTFGLSVFGIWNGISVLKKRNVPAVWFILITFLFSALLSAIFMNHHEKPDHILYGRYNEFALGGIFMLGILACFEKKNVWQVFAVFLCLAVFTGLRYRYDFEGIDSNLCHTWGLYFYKLIFRRFVFVGVVIWFGLWGGIFWFIQRKNVSSALLFLCGLFGVMMIYTKYDYFIKGASVRYESSQLSELVEDTVDAVPLEGDTMGYSWGVYHLLTLNPSLRLSTDADMVLTQEKEGTVLGSEKYDTLYLCEKNGVQKELSGEIFLKKWNEKGLTLFVRNNGGAWLCYQGTECLEDCVRIVGWIENADGEEEFRMDLSDNLYEGETLELEIPLSLPDGISRVHISPAVDLSYTIADVCVEITVKNGKMTNCKTTEVQKKEFSVLRPENYPKQITGMFRGYSTGETTIDHLSWNTTGTYLILHTKETSKEPMVSVNGQRLSLEKRKKNVFCYSLDGITELNQIVIESDTEAPAASLHLPSFLSFLRADSSCKPVSLFVRGLDRLFGIRLDFCSYGVFIDRIVIGEGL